MGRVVLLYDDHSSLARRLLKFVLSFHKTFTTESWEGEKRPNWRTRRAIRDVEKGRNLKTFDSVEAFEQYVREHV